MTLSMSSRCTFCKLKIVVVKDVERDEIEFIAKVRKGGGEYLER